MKGVRSPWISSPCSLEQFLRQWGMNETKMIFPYEYFESIESMRNQIDFPPYTGFFSSLKNKNVPMDMYNEAKKEYERRLCLSEMDPEKIRNFSDYLRLYQMS